MTMPSSFVRGALLALLTCGHGSFASSEPIATNPTLFAEDDGVATAPKRRELRLASLTIDVAIEGSIAATTLTAAFAGIPDETVEGHFSLALPEGAIVNGYALDIDDQMIEGVLIPRPRARDAYDSKVRQGIDPGFAEVIGGNVFATNVYPIQEDAGRKIRVQFASPMHQGLALPLATDAPIDSIEIRLRAREVTAAPQITLPSGLVANWHRTRDGYAASVSARAVSLNGSLAIAAVTPRRPALVSRDQIGQSFFQIRDAIPEEQRVLRPERIRVYWDHSLSRRDDDLRREIELLERYVRFTGGVVDLVTFNSSGARIVKIDSVERLRRELDLPYRGGTSFAVLDALRLPHAEVCLLFSDGNATIDRRDTFTPDCQLKAITSAADADRGYLAQLTRESGGVVVRLGADSSERAYERLVKQVPIITGAATNDGRPLSFAVLDNDQAGFFVVGEGPRSAEVILEFKGAYGRAFQQRYKPRRLQRDHFDGAAALWAADQIARLASIDGRFDELERLAQRYSIANPALAFVVLETPQDYAWADVALPKDYPAAARADYFAAKAERDAQLVADREAHVQALRDEWQAQKTWWSTEFDPRARPDRKRRGRAQGAGFDVGDLSEIVVTAQRREDVLLNSPISIVPWQADRPYLRALEQVAPNDLDRALAAQEQDHGHLPAFYLDTAEWLYQHDQVNEASEMLLSALELPLCNEETRSIVAERLLRYGYFDRAIALYEQAARLASHRPQPKMQLALALAKRAAIRTQSAKRDLRRAIQLLNDVAMTPWNGAYDGIAMIALMEANALIPRLHRLGGARVALAPELIALLDLDIRVVIQWNTAATDLDLWVDEPNGERAIYSNRFTAIGGRLSNDMTSGYGPEEYLLRKAAPGEYRVNIDVFATDAINPNGATTVTARLIRDFGRPSEHEESVDVELLPDATGEQLVGRIYVGGAE